MVKIHLVWVCIYIALVAKSFFRDQWMWKRARPLDTSLFKKFALVIVIYFTSLPVLTLKSVGIILALVIVMAAAVVDAVYIISDNLSHWNRKGCILMPMSVLLFVIRLQCQKELQQQHKIANSRKRESSKKTIVPNKFLTFVWKRTSSSQNEYTYITFNICFSIGIRKIEDGWVFCVISASCN